MAVVVLAAFVLDRLALAAEARGWIYWRRRGPSRGAVGAAMQQIMLVFDPAPQHVLEERVHQADDADLDPGGQGPPVQP